MKNSEISSKSLLIIIFSTFQSSSGMPGSTTCQYHFKLINSLAMAGAKYLQSKTRYKHDNQRHPVSKWILEYFLLKPKIDSTASQQYLKGAINQSKVNFSLFLLLGIKLYRICDCTVSLTSEDFWVRKYWASITGLAKPSWRPSSKQPTGPWIHDLVHK